MVAEKLEGRHRAETTIYTSCICNCGSNSQCVLKAHVKDGIVVAVEPDDRYNAGVGREDEVLSEQELIAIRLQRRPCTKGLVFHKYLYHPERILYPLKRVTYSKRGEGKYERISWDEALTTVAEKMKEVRQKYGPLSIITPYMPNETLARLFSFWGAGVDSWGWCSYDATRLMSHIVTGETGWNYAGYCSGSASDMLANSTLIVIWGLDPTIGSNGPGYQFAWFIKLARERGKRVIIIDPRYTVGAEVLADQWIPIKPGTDTAMFLAMAYVLFKDDLWDKGFVAKYVEPLGFNKWRNYILGTEDGIEKTPEWAERLCAVPAETMRALAKLIGTTKPSFLWCNWGVSRKSRGENTVRVFAALQAMMGYWGTPGAGPPLNIGPRHAIPWRSSWGPSGEYNVPKLYRSHYWAQAVLLLEKVRGNELSGEDYMRMVGWRAPPSLLKDFNPKLLFWGGGTKPHASDHLVTACESPNYQIEAMARMEFIVAMHSIMTPTTKYADIIFPALDWMWEEKNITKNSYGGFECINYCPGVVKPPGDVKPWAWVYTKLAEKLGINPQKFFRYYTTDENWERDWERYQMDCYQSVVDYYKKRNVTVPSWEEFIHGKFINCDELNKKPFTGWDEQIKKGKPFKTNSGKIEFYSNYIANEANRGKGEHYDTFGRLYENLPADWGTLSSIATYRTAVRGMDDYLVKKYPLSLLCPHARYRVHYLFWEHPWLRGHIYQHRVWISPTDAKDRGIKDGDMIQVYNDRGKVVMPAYVTSRIMPGIIAIHHGGKYIPNESGVDFGASPSTLLGGDFESCITSAKATNLVQVKKY
ncbi:MAG: molybdopterin-dependent oxidoreductase [Candidatus Hodarchaeota archaeon]